MARHPKTIPLRLYTAPLRNQWKAESIDDVVDVPYAQAIEYLDRGLAVVPRGVTVERATAGPDDAEAETAAAAPSSSSPEPSSSEAEVGDLPPWEPKTPPQTYLSRYGDDAKYSALAQRYVDAGRGDA